ncbi:MAG: class I SAM-dependent methyltransferase [Thermodesulfobacteriota bacterium]
MRKKIKFGFLFFSLCFYLCLQVVASGFATETAVNQSLDHRVRNFLDSHIDSWRDMNVPEVDGKVLYDLIIKHKYKKALEIGTSTGHSGIWIAWALSKTGGKLITIEINEGRYKQALANFEEAGLSDYIDARLADAHELVPKLKGPLDFVFFDADKGWSTNYFMAVLPKLEVGGCYTAHNVSARSRGRMQGIGEFLDYVESLPNMETTYDDSSSAGISISYKRSEK